MQAWAQEEEGTPTTEETVSSNPTLEEQYQTIKRKSNKWKSRGITYLVIEPAKLDAIWNQVPDSLAKERQEIVQLNENLQATQTQITKLNEELTTKNSMLEKSDYINVLGIDWLKQSYITFNWIVILILVGALVFLFFRYTSSIKVANQKRKETESIESELKAIKKKAQDKEIQLRRELVTERNKGEELQQKLIALKKDK
ncbi:hypothetical protein GCM10023331_34590 [Algivirga pacifica]|uniref:tRNA (Guanine-N1)-methyltransferase n=1 Tax=Algivirga pacifica TaxID=1162670 RepID=A0ABP9DLV8_9BACT